ncbi:DEAD-box ATP-dependent RNA helicase 13 [Hypsibius exemplaris]|uniref:ATP-dependent RNA helicase n=1 Tax=Hypsibius exemplaris TaxID=2072580 RepID=A0A1W0WA15_HYPEX|nr:DEAD-box ATP-dependent RNA helicase 13 [Hypsibius exemplaris]
MPKRKHIQEIISSGGWKQVAFPKPFSVEEAGGEAFEGLIEIEELTDYEIGYADQPIKKLKEKPVDGEDVQPSKKKLRAEKRKEERRDAKKLVKAKKLSAAVASANSGEVDSTAAIVSTHPKKLKKPPAEPEIRPLKSILKKAKPIPAESEDLLDIPVPATPDEEGSDSDWEDDTGDIDDDEEGLNEITDEGMGEDEGEPIDMSKWEQLNVSEPILKALREMKFATPTAIQESCLPAAIRSRKDIIGAAETGSGKTLAFAIPILQNIMEDKATEPAEREPYLRALIITPTRELAAQIVKHVTAVGKYTDVTTCLVVGGMFKEKQDRLLKKQPDIVIATPGRLYEHIQNQTPYLQTLTSIRYLVIDEADRMVEAGHFKELTNIMEIFAADARAAAKRQTFVFSATLAMEVDTAITGRKKPMKRPAKTAEETDRISGLYSVLGLKTGAKLVDLSKPEGTAGSLVERRLPCTLKDKDYLFYYLLMTEATGRVIVFCNSLDCVRRLHGVFSYLLTETGRTPLVLHAGMHQKQRLKNLERFQANPKAVLLASDVASRGLDIPDVQFVIHYQVPRKPDLYVHRSGRTARAFKVGSSVLLVDPSDAPASEKILRCLHRDRDFPLVEVDSRMLRFAKERVDLARQIDVVEHALRKESSQDEWYLKAAEESDLVLDKQERKKLEIQKGDGRSRQSKQAKSLKRAMKQLLAQPLRSRMPGFSHQYPALNFAKQKLGFA